MEQLTGMGGDESSFVHSILLLALLSFTIVCNRPTTYDIVTPKKYFNRLHKYRTS